MKISLPQASAAHARVGALSVGDVRVGPARVGRLRVRNLRLDAAVSRAELRDVTLQLELGFSLDWSVGFVIDAPDPWPDIRLGEHGTLDLGRMTVPLHLGHLALPGLAALPLRIPQAAATDVQAVLGALGPLRLGPAVAEQVRLRGVQLPDAGLAVQGLGVAGLRLEGVAVPAASAQQVDVGRLAAGSVPIPSVTLRGLQLPPTRVDPLKVAVQGARTQTMEARLGPTGNGLIDATLAVRATAGLTIGELWLTGLQAGAEVDEIELRDVQLPLELLDVTLSQLGIGEIAVPTLEMR